jgi:hypothetical protein
LAANEPIGAALLEAMDKGRAKVVEIGSSTEKKAPAAAEN